MIKHKEIVTLNNLVIGAKVTRGPMWHYREQDGGAGSIGIIKEIEEDTNWIVVVWSNETENTYESGGTLMYYNPRFSTKERSTIEDKINNIKNLIK